jgi:catechol 2,3-dioxygenase-like lactoylglutathione lyase family enzyme
MSAHGWAAEVTAITLVVADLEVSKAFYAAAFGAPLIFEDSSSAVFGFGATMVNLLHRSAADELLSPAPVGSSGDPARIVLTVPVPDTDAASATLTALGVTLINGPTTRPWGPRTASFADPDGHVWEIACTPAAG